jgi:hypothetical protein
MLKYLVIVTLLWAVTQTPSPVPEKALDSASQTAASVQHQGKNDKGDPTSSDGSGWGLVIVGVLQTLLFTVTWIAIRQQATTQKTAERAWMIITPDKPEGWEPILLPEQPGVPATLNVFRAAIKNVGRTPAHVTKIAARYINLDKSEFKNLPEEPDYGTKESLESMLLVPGDSFPKAVPLWPKSRLTTEEIESIRTAKSFLYFYARIEYRALGKKRETRVGFIYPFPPGTSYETPRFRRSGPPAYNRAT